MATFTMDMPPALPGGPDDARILRQYLARLVDRLLYALNNIDSENITIGGVRTDNFQGGAAGIAKAAFADIGVANIGRADVQHLQAQVAEIVTGVIQTAVIDWAKITKMETDLAYIHTLETKYANIAALEAEIARIADLEIAQAHIQEADVQMLKAYCAEIVNASIQTADISYAQIQDADIQNLIAHDAVTDRYYIDKLAVRNAQIVAATVGDLVIKASDGHYYRLDVDEDGAVTPTDVTQTITGAEIAAGVTSDGHGTIIETDLTVTDLSATNFKSLNALIDKLTAARINVDELFARQATINKITTGAIASALGSSLNLSSNTSIITNVQGTNAWQTAMTKLDTAATTADSAQETADSAQQTADGAATAADELGEALETWRTDQETTITQLQDAVSLRVTEATYNADQQAVTNRLTAVEANTHSVETRVQNLQDGIGTHFIVEEDKVRITQDHQGVWEQQLTADKLSFVNRETGAVAASFGVAGGMADRLRSNQELSVGTTAAGWYDMTVMRQGVADKWRDGTETVLPAMIMQQPVDSYCAWQVGPEPGSHPTTGNTSWKEVYAFATTADHVTNYQWQYRERSVFGAWTNLQSDFENGLLRADFDSNVLVREYRCKMTGANGEQLISETVRAYFPEAPVILKEPQDAVEAASGETVTVSLTAGTDAASYQWQIDSGNSWQDVQDATAATAVLEIPPQAKARCLVRSAEGALVSSRIVTNVHGG